MRPLRTLSRASFLSPELFIAVSVHLPAQLLLVEAMGLTCCCHKRSDACPHPNQEIWSLALKVQGPSLLVMLRSTSFVTSVLRTKSVHIIFYDFWEPILFRWEGVSTDSHLHVSL